ncbi:DUF3800 domain-containing protein [Pseudomonadota bacterium]
MDESGDLGFNFKKSKTTKNFIVTFLFTENKRVIEKAVRKTFRSFPEKDRHKHCGVLHAFEERPKNNRKLLKYLTDSGKFRIMVIKLNKNRIHVDFENQPNYLYASVVNILIDRIITNNLISSADTIHFIASQKDTNKFLNGWFKEYLNSRIKPKHPSFNISVKKPAEEKCLQAVDCISWSLFRKYEHSDESYYNNIKDFIVEECELYK